MNEKEGVIKYKLTHKNISVNKNISITEINAWRTVFFKLGLIGQIEGRYEGYGFGNISQRISSANTNKINFIISGTQTGKIECLSENHYCMIKEASPEQNSIKSAGKTRPSSEALTHASVYQLNNAIQSVIHIHCPEIWQNSQELDMPCTSPAVEYGTPEMAQEVKRLFHSASLQNTAVFSMLGHEDGIISYSDSMEKSACLLIKLYSKAISIGQNKQSNYNIGTL